MIATSLRRLGLAVALAGLSALAAAGVAAQTSDGEGDEGPNHRQEALAAAKEHAARQRKRVENLTVSASPRDWALASQIDPLDPDWFERPNDAALSEAIGKAGARRAELLRNAAAAAPRDALVQWLALHHMPRSGAGCSSSTPSQERIDAVLALEPDNALAWTATLEQAAAAKDDIAIDTTLARMAAAPRFDDHSTEYTLAVLDADRRFPDTAVTDEAQNDEAAFVGAVMQGIWMGYRSHDFGDVCDAGKHLDADIRRFAACADLGRRLSREASRLTLRNAGFKLLHESAQSDADDAARERELMWLMAQVTTFEPATRDEGDELLRVGKAAWLERQDDAAALRAVLEHRGISTTPPVGWQVSAAGDESAAALPGADE